MNEREELANLIPLGFTARDPYRNTFEAADAILAWMHAQGYRKTPEPRREYAVAKEAWPSTPIYRMRDRESAERHVANPPIGEARHGWIAIYRDVIEPGPWLPVEEKNP